jgi:N-acetylmuramic acid 6-phosphate etherase
LGDLTQLDRAQAQQLLAKSNNQVKLALLMHWTGLDATAGEALLSKPESLRSLIQQHSSDS